MFYYSLNKEIAAMTDVPISFWFPPERWQSDLSSQHETQTDLHKKKLEKTGGERKMIGGGWSASVRDPSIHPSTHRIWRRRNSAMKLQKSTTDGAGCRKQQHRQPAAETGQRIRRRWRRRRGDPCVSHQRQVVGHFPGEIAGSSRPAPLHRRQVRRRA